jgi:hypothetical protein
VNFPDTEEVTGSNPVRPTRRFLVPGPIGKRSVALQLALQRGRMHAQVHRRTVIATAGHKRPHGRADARGSASGRRKRSPVQDRLPAHRSPVGARSLRIRL